MPYEFTRDSFRQFNDDIIKAGGDQATLTTILADMQDTVFNNIGIMENLSKDKETLTKENERLRQANMDLFLRVGQQATPSESSKSQEQENMSTSEYMEKYFDKLEGK